MPRSTPEMRKQDVARAWRDWARNAPLDLFEEFHGTELEEHRVGPHGESTLHLSTGELKDGKLSIVIHVDPPQEEE